MRDGPRRRPPAQQPPPRRPLIAAVLRAAVVAAAVALISRLAAPSGFWACVPGALLLAASARSELGTAAGTLAVVSAAWAPRSHGAPSPILGLVVAGSGTAVLHGMRRRLEHERDSLRRSALRDPLTGVFNRRGLDERLGYEIARHTRHGESFSVLALDLDGFKAVNDRFGHDAGDEVLCETASALVGAVRAQDTVVRLGGDEFCVLAPQTDAAHAEHLVERVRESLAAVTTGVSGLSASIGTAVFPADGTTPDGLLAEADTAAIAAKRQSRLGRPQRRAA
jgi:diguanylate cyclase (GGDEF)-like protein